MTPSQFKNKVRNTFANNWWAVAAYVTIGAAIRLSAERTRHREQAELIAKELAPHLEELKKINYQIESMRIRANMNNMQENI